MGRLIGVSGSSQVIIPTVIPTSSKSRRDHGEAVINDDTLATSLVSPDNAIYVCYPIEFGPAEAGSNFDAAAPIGVVIDP